MVQCNMGVVLMVVVVGREGCIAGVGCREIHCYKNTVTMCFQYSHARNALMHTEHCAQPDSAA